MIPFLFLCLGKKRSDHVVPLLKKVFCGSPMPSEAQAPYLAFKPLHYLDPVNLFSLIHEH